MVWMRIKDTRGRVCGRSGAGVDKSLLLILRWSSSCGVAPCYGRRFRFRLGVVVRYGIAVGTYVSDLVVLHSAGCFPTPVWSGMETRKLTLEP
jgi:hypothetical protein